MTYLKCIIIKRSLDNPSKEGNNSNKVKHVAKPDNYDNSKEDEDEEDNFFSSEAFKKYIHNHGYHFTEPLAEFAIGMISNHKWDIGQVKSYLNTQGVDLNKTKHPVTLGDMAYAANMYHSDFSVSDAQAFQMSLAIANDDDGYEGQLFSRWLSDIMQKNINIDWELYY